MTATQRSRLDTELVRRGLARSRTRAGMLIAAGRVDVGGQIARRAAAAVPADVSLVVRPDPRGPDLVSRAGHKLQAALSTFAIEVSGRRCLDAGASTGGFTDVLLRAGARQVVAVDVGHDQLDARLRDDDRVAAYEGCNVRTLRPVDVGGASELTVADLSFIPLRLVLPALVACTTTGGDLVLLVKPQFEVGRERLGDGGVVREPALHRAVLHDVAVEVEGQGPRLRGAMRSPLDGEHGNVEFLLWATRDTERAVPGLTPQEVVAQALDVPAPATHGSREPT